MSDGKIKRYLDEADVEAGARLVEGAKVYGPVGFLKRDTYKDIREEILDCINYFRFLYVKVRLMEDDAYDGSSDHTS